MNKLSTAKRTQVIAALFEGAGVDSVSRMTGVGKPTILGLLANLGKACQEYQDRTLRNLTCKRIQVENHIYSMTIYTMYYNFVRIHSTLRVTPAMEAGVSSPVWSLEEMIELIN